MAMTTVRSSGADLHVVVDGPAGAPVLMLSNSLATNLHMWDEQVEVWSKAFQVVRYDRRGHGRSSAPPGPYSFDMLGRDALAIMDALRLARVNWCGLSMGGMVGQWLGANAPEKLDRLILSNTHYHFADKQAWDDRIALTGERGMSAVAETTIQRWFSPEFRQAAPERVDFVKAMLLATPIDGYAGCCAALRDMDFRSTNPRIGVPTLVIAGRADPVTTPEAGREIQRQISHARYVEIDAAHIANVERPAAYTKIVMDFLSA